MLSGHQRNMVHKLQSAMPSLMQVLKKKTSSEGCGWLSPSASPSSPGRRSCSAGAHQRGLGSKRLALQSRLARSPLPSTRRAMRAQQQHPEGSQRAGKGAGTRRQQKQKGPPRPQPAGLFLSSQRTRVCACTCACSCVRVCVYTCKGNILHWPGDPGLTVPLCIKHRWSLMGHQYLPPVSFTGTLQPPVGRQGQGKHTHA